MGLLEKLMPQPRWKHADPAVRLEAVRTLEDPAELASLVETDPDARVRRAVIAKTSDPVVLAQLARADADAEVRERAAERLLDVATGAPEESMALRAVRGLNDARRLSTIAKSEASDAVRAEALARIADARALGGIARHAKHESTAGEALDRLTDHDREEFLNVALNGEHRDVALRAFDRAISGALDLALLRSIESRAQQKVVVKRARALIQEIEDAEAARRAAAEERQRQQLSLVEGVERLAGLAIDVSLMETELERLTEAWHALAVRDETSESRFAAGVAEVHAAVARRTREAEEAAERARLRAEAIATRDALCQRVETLEGDDLPAQLSSLQEEWRSQMPLVGEGPEAERLADRFARAVAECRKRHEAKASLAETEARLEALVTEAEGLLTSTDRAAAEARWLALSKEAGALASDDLAELKGRLVAVGQSFIAREQARREAELKTQRDHVAQLDRLAERAKRFHEAETVTLREGDRLMRDIAAGLETVSRGEGAREGRDSREIEEAASRLRALQETVAPRVHELREMDEWRRFANAQRQEQLIAMAEAIVASLKADMESGKESDLGATARALRELHTKWQEVADAPRQSAQRLWDRFRTATDFIRSRCAGYFANLRAERETNLQQKVAVVVEAESLASSSDWVNAAKRLQELQTAWQQLGPVPRDAARDLAQRFRTACNTFFARRREDLTTRKKVWADNLEKKEALCARAEALAESTDWEPAFAEMKRLQAEWKNAGPLRRNKSEAMWTRFRAAVDRFFERYHHRHEIMLAGKIAERESLVVDLETLAGSADDAVAGPPADLLERVQQLRATWSRSVPVPTAEMKALHDRWQTAFARIVERWPDAFRGTDLDPTAIRQKLDKLVAKVESYLEDIREAAPGLSQAEILAARLRSALATNAMGGRVNQESKWRAAADAVKDAQSAWQRLSALAGTDAKTLEPRFRDACRRVSEHARRQAAPQRRPSAKPTAAAV
jgi:hypothetical protein